MVVLKMEEEPNMCIYAKKEIIPEFDGFYHNEKNIGIWGYEGHRYVCTKFADSLTETNRFCDADCMDKCIFYKF